MRTETNIDVKQIQTDDEKKESDQVKTKSNLPTKHDPKTRMTYIVPEEIYPENIDIWPHSLFKLLVSLI